MALLGNRNRFEYIFGRLRKASVSAMSVVIASVIVGCATTAPVEEEEEEKPTPVVEEKKVEVAPLEFESVHFEYNQYAIRASAKSSLKSAVDQLLERADAKINIEGHCDERGTDQYNIDLGWKRAYEVRDYLKRLGVDEARMFPISYGRARPAVVGHNESSWSKNRRTEISERK